MAIRLRTRERGGRARGMERGREGERDEGCRERKKRMAHERVTHGRGWGVGGRKLILPITSLPNWFLRM